MCGGSTGTSWSTSTSPVTTSFSFATAPRSPTPSASTGTFSLPWSRRICPMPLLRVRARVDERRVARDGAGEDAEAADAARERVGDRLEDEHRLLRVAELDRRPLARRRRDALDEQVEERGRAEVLRRDAAADGIELVARDRALERVGDVLGGQLLALEVARHQVLVRLDDGVEELLAVLLHLVGHLVGDRLRSALLAAGGIHVRAHVQQVDDAGELVLDADRQLDRDAAVGELLLRGLEDAEEVGALAVEHVDEDDARELVLLRARPDAGACSPRRP